MGNVICKNVINIDEYNYIMNIDYKTFFTNFSINPTNVFYSILGNIFYFKENIYTLSLPQSY